MEPQITQRAQMKDGRWVRFDRVFWGRKKWVRRAGEKSGREWVRFDRVFP